MFGSPAGTPPSSPQLQPFGTPESQIPLTPPSTPPPPSTSHNGGKKKKKKKKKKK